MKKLMFAAAVMTVGMAMAVESQIVGYSTRQMGKNQFRLMGVPWKTCANTYNINDLLKLDKDPAYEIQNWDDPLTELLANAPQLQVRNSGGGYDNYFWVKNGWLNDGSNDGAGQDVAGWCNESGMYAISTNPEIEPTLAGNLTPGVGAWFCNPLDSGTTTPMMSGAVETDDYQLDCPKGFSIRCLTVPADVHVADATKILFSDIDGSYEIENWDDPLTELLENAPQIQIGRTGDGYDCYFYVKNAWLNDGSNDGAGQDVEGWCNETGMLAIPSNPEIDPTLVGNIPAGSAMWTQGIKSTFKVKFFGLK